MKQPVTWIVVADGSRARFYRLADDQRSIAASEARLESARARGKAEDLVTDRAGLAFDSAGAGRHAMEPEVTPQEREKERFQNRVAEAMRDALAAGEVERFVLVAEPRTLGALRATLPAHVHGRVVAELDKDHTDTPLDQLFAQVRPLLPSPLA
ncbi:MAG: host attachment protein [Alphaproteobacteria bacterium]